MLRKGTRLPAKGPPDCDVDFNFSAERHCAGSGLPIALGPFTVVTSEIRNRLFRLIFQFAAHGKLTCRPARQPRPRDARGRDAEAAAHWLQVGGAFLLVWAAALAKEIGITTVRSAPCQYLSVRHLTSGQGHGHRRSEKGAMLCR